MLVVVVLDWYCFSCSRFFNTVSCRWPAWDHKFAVAHSLRRGKKNGCDLGLEAMEEDSRPPVLLLRTFADDSVRIYGAAKRYWFSLTQPLSSTFEEMLYDMFKPHGPVIAIGRPKETLALALPACG